MQSLSIPFIAHDQEHEVLIVTDDDKVTVRAFNEDTGEPANGYFYHIDREIAAHFKDITSLDVVEALALEAIRDVKSRRWEKFLKRVSKAKGVTGVPPAKLT